MKDNALYLEVDEDITSAIDKLTKSAGDSVQIVVPKRSGLLQSIINLKLLKKAADNAGKELVLVTNDTLATELAARVGLAVAPSIGAAPVEARAAAPEAFTTDEEVIDENTPAAAPPAKEAAPAPGRAAAAAMGAKLFKPKKPVLTRKPISDDPPRPAGEEAAADLTPAAARTTAVKVPNFHRLQRRLLWVGLAAVLIGGYLLGMFLFTSAKVTLYASGSRVGIDTTFAVDPAATTSDQTKAVLAGQTVTVSKDLTGSFVPSGKKDVGTKAAGTMTIKNEYDTNPHPLQSGTRFQAPDGNIFRSTSDVTVPGATPTLINGKLGLSPGTVTVNVTADQNGDTYNEAPARYTIPGLPADQQSQIYGQGDQMSGGTTKTVNVVSQSDVDTAKAAALDKDKDNAPRDLQAKVPAGYLALTSSQATSATATSSPAVDAQGDTGSVDVKVTYTLIAVRKSDYQDFIHSQEQKQVGDNNQIYDDGIAAAQVTSSDKDAAGRPTFHFTTEASGGQKIDKLALAKKLAGQRFGDASNIATGLPGVSRADIAIWPGWVSNMPSRPDKINITIQIAADK